MAKPFLVSVIIPVYNQASYVDEAIQSVFQQSYGNIQLILIDDASTDESGEKLNKYSGRDNVLVFHNPVNLDCAGTFNRGLELACGKYCGILAADDTWEPDFVAKCVAALEKHPLAAFCYCRVNLMRFNGLKTPRTRDRIPHRGDYYGPEFENIVRNLNPIPHHATVVRKECLDELGGYDPALTTTHDWDLWLRLSRKHPAVFIDEHLANYRVHESNISRSRSRSGEKERLIIALLDRVFKAEGLPERLFQEKKEIYARAYLDIAEGYRVIADRMRMRKSWFQALRLSRKPGLFLQYRRLLISLVVP